METKSSNINSAGFSLPSVLVGVALLGISAVIVSNTVVDARRSQRTADLKLSTNKLQQAALDAVTRRVKDFVIGDCKGDRWSSNSSVTDVEKAFSELPLIQDSGAASRLVFTKVKGEIPSSFDCAQPESPATLGTGDSFRFCMEIESPGASQAVERRLLELLIVPVNLASDQAIKCLDAAGAGAGVKVAWQLHTQIDNKKVNQSNSKSFLKDSGVFLVSMETESYSGTCNITASRVGSTNQCTVNVSGLGRRPPTLLRNGVSVTGFSWARAPSANLDAFTATTTCPIDQSSTFSAQSAVGSDACDAVRYTLTTSVTGSGSISKSPNTATYIHGTSVTLTATPNAGSTFSGWSGACSGTATTCTVTMDNDKSVVANFTRILSCDSGTRVTQTQTLSFPSTTGTQCRWSNDGNMSAMDLYPYDQTRAVAKQSLNISMPNKKICSISLQAPSQVWTYDDFMFVTLNGFILASGQFTRSEFLAMGMSTFGAGTDSLIIYDKSRHVGKTPYTVSMNNRNSQICPNPGSCVTPKSDVMGVFTMNVLPGWFAKMPVVDQNRESHELAIWITGNAHNTDCQHSGITFTAEIQYVE